jgi:bacillithiol biosynthesis cysteine-adding enzyme BshC
LSEATRVLAHGLFGKYGLLVIDADDRRLKQLFAPIITKDILEQVSFHASQQAIEKLETRYSVQVNGREINFFYLSEGSRERIVSSGEGFSTHNGLVNWNSRDELTTEISAYPERFSPNVMMRPVYQETILPNLAYFGGAAEVAYWLELKPVFDAHQVPYPALLLRNSAMVVDAVNVHRMENGGLMPKDLFDSQVKIEQRAVIQDAQGDLTLKDQKEKLQQWIDEMTTRAASISSSMQSSTEAFGVRLLHQTDRLAAKFVREARKHESESLARIRALFADLYPDGKLQERKETIFTFMLLHGSEILDELLECQSPIGNEFIVLMID